MYRYTVRCEFTLGDSHTIESWLEWLREPHIADVMKGGATGAEVVKMTSEHPTYEIRYRFPNEAAFVRYENEFAPQLKAEGRKLFPPDKLNMVYQRSNGEVVLEI